MNTPNTHRSLRRWIGFTAFSVVTVMALAKLFSPVFDFNRWDNFEFHTPILVETHSQWLSGHVPLINWHQNLGEPLLANAQPGVFYFPYTLSVAAVRALAISPRQLILLVIVLHLMWAAIGWLLLFQSWGIRSWVACTAAVSLCFSGFLSLISLAWVFMPVIFSWIPWILFGLFSDTRSARLWAPIGLAAVFWVGYPQLAIYVWLTALLACAAHALLDRQAGNVQRWAVAFALGALMSACTTLPIFESMLSSPRVDHVSLGEFLNRSVSVKALWGFFKPWVPVDNGFLAERGSLAFFHAPWMLPIVLIGLFLSIRDRTDAALRRRFFAFSGFALLFTLFALGSNTPLYPLTHAIPVWSSLRYPFKFLLLVNTMLGIAAAIGLELWLRAEARKKRALATDMSKKIGRVVFMLFNILVGVVVVVLAQMSGLKRYPEPYAATPATSLGMTSDDRAITLSSFFDHGREQSLMQPLGLYHAATMNGTYALTGHVTDLAPLWFLKHLPAGMDGVMSPSDAAPLLGSYLLRSWNVGYAFASNEHPQLLTLLTKRGYRVAATTDKSTVFRDDQVLPKVFFASDVKPYADNELVRGLISNQATPTTVFVEGDAPIGAVSQGRITAAKWLHARIDIDVETTASGFMAVSACFFPQWKVFVDGIEQKVYRVNGTIMGTAVPAGAKHISLRYRPMTLPLGLLALAIGIGCLIFIHIRKRN